MTAPSPGQLIEELKAFLYPYIVIGPLVSALFADKIDNVAVACLLFVGFVGAAFNWFSKRIQLLEAAVRELENKLREYEKQTGVEH
jgi:hypothetical protein